MSQNKSILSYTALGVGVLALSFSGMFVRWADAPGPVTAFYRLFFSIFLLLPLFMPRARANPSARSSLVIYPLLAGVFTAFDLALWTSSLSYTTVSNATLLGNTAPLWVALAGWLIYKQRFPRNFWAGLGLALFGAALIISADFILHPRFGVGDVMAIFTGFFYGCYFLLTEKSRKKFDSFSHIWFVGVGASLALFVINLVLGYRLTGYNTQSWLVFLASAIVSQVVGYTALAYALGHLPATIVAPTMILQPVVTTLLAIPFFGEVPTIWQALGGGFALAGIYIVNQTHHTSQPETPNA